MRILLVLGVAGTTWFLSLLSAIATGQYQLACEIFVYGGLACWGALTLWGGMLEKAARVSAAQGLAVPQQSEVDPVRRGVLSRGVSGPLLGFTIAVGCVIALIFGCVATGNLLIAGAIAFSAGAGALAVTWGSQVS